MRYKEFTINIPINIKFNGNGDPEVGMTNSGNSDINNQSTINTRVNSDNDPGSYIKRKTNPKELDQDPVFVPPLQQQIELAKAGRGKNSKIIDKLTADGPKDDKDESHEVGAPYTVKNKFK